jgi:hypothetical protein
MKRAFPFLCGAILAVAHFAASLLIVPLTLKVGEALPDGAADSFLFGLLTQTTKLLYFPILSLALYPRHWFPGQMITIAIAVNSLLWGAALVLVIWFVRRVRGHSRS